MKRTPTTLHTPAKFLRTSGALWSEAASWTLPVFLEKTFFALNAMAAEASFLTQTVTGKDRDDLLVEVLQMASAATTA